MDLTFSPAEEAFRAAARAFLSAALAGEFADVCGRGGPGDEHALFERRHAWERTLGAAGYTCLWLSPALGGRGASLYDAVGVADTTFDAATVGTPEPCGGARRTAGGRPESPVSG